MKKYILITIWSCLLGLLCISVGSLNAAPDLLLPAYTKHIQYDNEIDYTEGFDNTSIGLNWSFPHADLGSAYVFKNSHDKPSIYNYAIGYVNPTGVKMGGGILAAVGGYDVPIILGPVFAVKYGWVRLVTTYPIGKLNGADFDLLNVQLMIPLE